MKRKKRKMRTVELELAFFEKTLASLCKCPKASLLSYGGMAVCDRCWKLLP